MQIDTDIYLDQLRSVRTGLQDLLLLLLPIKVKTRILLWLKGGWWWLGGTEDTPRKEVSWQGRWINKSFTGLTSGWEWNKRRPPSPSYRYRWSRGGIIIRGKLSISSPAEGPCGMWNIEKNKFQAKCGFEGFKFAQKGEIYSNESQEAEESWRTKIDPTTDDKRDALAVAGWQQTE